MSLYCISSDTAAALVIARRALRKSERIPTSYARSVQVDSSRHVWSFWSALNKKLLKFFGLAHKFPGSPQDVPIDEAIASWCRRSLDCTPTHGMGETPPQAIAWEQIPQNKTF